jgi:tetratricopeptide (TPR) repeat protein
VRALVVVAAFAVAVAVFARGEDPAVPVERPVLTGTASDIPGLQRAVRGGRDDLRPALADAYLQRARETADPSYYAKATTVLGTPRTEEAFATAGELALARHAFADALALGRRAGALGAPVRVDALVELGRLDAAEAELQAMIDRRPNLAAYARVSYVRELRGDLDGAVEAMRLAVAAGGPAAAHVASVSALLGELERRRGRPAAARRAFARALALVPGHPASESGLFRLDHDLERLERLVARLPLPEYVIALGEAQLAVGKPAQRTFALVTAEQRLLGSAGVDTDVELAVFEADHGDPSRAVALARRGYEKAPSARAADALGWALSRAGKPKAGLRYAREALRDGAVDPLWLAHAGLAEEAAGRDGRRELRRALAHGLDGYPWQAGRVRAALR